MEAFSYPEASLVLHRLMAWLLADIVTFANLVQVPAVALTGAAAWLVSRPLRRQIAEWARNSANPHLDRIARYQSWIVDRLVPLIAPALWGAGLWVAVAAAQYFSWPHDVARIAANLLLAWLVIRLAADFVPSPALSRLIAALAWSLAALNILHLLVPFLDLLDSVAITVGALRVSLFTVIKGVISLIVLLWAATLASRLFERRITRVTTLTPRAQVLLGKLLQITLLTLAVVLSLTSVGIDLSTFAILTGAVGVGIGLGLQKTVSNLFSGIILLLDRSIKPGDVIEVGGTYGWVSSMGARYVAVETRDGTEYLIPNEDIITHQVLNWSHKSERVRLKVPVRAPLDADLEQVIALLKEAASRPTRVLWSPAPTAIVMGFGESAIELEVRFWIADAHNGVHNVKSEALLEIWRMFRAHGIPIPYPKRDLFVHAEEQYREASPATTTAGLRSARDGYPRDVVPGRAG
jgi:small-conductance mechanosensitive channel